MVRNLDFPCEINDCKDAGLITPKDIIDLEAGGSDTVDEESSCSTSIDTYGILHAVRKRKWMARYGYVNRRPSFDDIIAELARQRVKDEQRRGAADCICHRRCNFWSEGNCKYRNDECKFLHSNSFGDIGLLAHHKEATMGITVSYDGKTIYTVPGEGEKIIVREHRTCIWNWRLHCNILEFVKEIDCRKDINREKQEIGCIVSIGPWVFVGLVDRVKGWNTNRVSSVTELHGPKGLVRALVYNENMIFAGAEDGVIVGWLWFSNYRGLRAGYHDGRFEYRGHMKPIVGLVIESGRLYSASIDQTIRVWDIASLQCLQAYKCHSDGITSLLVWKEFLFSSYLDGTVMVWVDNIKNAFEPYYTHIESNSVLRICKAQDLQGNPVLMCCCSDNTVRVYGLSFPPPTEHNVTVEMFKERAILFSECAVQTVESTQSGYIFTSDKAGIKIWRWSPNKPISKSREPRPLIINEVEEVENED